MFLSIATTRKPATDLGYLLMKHPDRVHPFDLTHGKATVFFPEATEDRCEAALILEINPLDLIRGRAPGGMLDAYVNDRPYAASSLLTTAINRAFKTAMNGVSKDRQALADGPMPLEIRITPVPSSGNGWMAKNLFEPLGWTVDFTPIESSNGRTRYIDLRLTGDLRLADALNQLFVLIPAMDNTKHYWIGEDEIEKLLAKGGEWLKSHPRRELITSRYLKNQRNLTATATARFTADEPVSDPEPTEKPIVADDDGPDVPVSLNATRLDAVTDLLVASGATSVVDLGCGEGKLLAKLATKRQFTKILGLDASVKSLRIANARLKLDRADAPNHGRIKLLHGSIHMRDERWEDVDAVALVEVIEHVERDRLPALFTGVLGAARPKVIVVTTPNAEYNQLYDGIKPGAFRHPDHRFELTRAEFQAMISDYAKQIGYGVTFVAIGEEHPEFGPSTQAAVFTK